MRVYVLFESLGACEGYEFLGVYGSVEDLHRARESFLSADRYRDADDLVWSVRELGADPFYSDPDRDVELDRDLFRA